MSKHPYTYTVLRYVHDTGTGEFANVGVVLTSPAVGYADAILRPTYGRLSKMFPGMDGDHFRRVIRHIQSRLEEISARMREEMNLGDRPSNALELAHRVIAPDDSAFQWSPMGSGVTSDLPSVLEKIYEAMVTRYDEQARSESRSDEAVWKVFRTGLETRMVLSRFGPKTISVADDEVVFSHAWQNQKWHCLETVSFDLMQPQSIKDKAHAWLGRITSIREAREPFKLYYLVGEPHLERSRRAFEQALNVLHKTPVTHEIVREEEADSFAASMADQVSSHEASADGAE